MPARTPRRDCVWYRWTNRALLALLALYLTLVVAVESRMGAPEIYPFASWSLFSLVPNEVNDYSIRVIEVDGRPLDAPPFFEESGAYFRSTRLNSARMMLQDFAEALERGSARTAEGLRRRFELMHLAGPDHVVYDVVARRYDPLERWREGTFRDVRTVARFRTGSQDDRPVARFDPASPEDRP